MSATKTKLAPAHTLSRRGEGPNPIDIHVGSRLRLRRTLLGLSQEKLGEAVGITFQQLQKYERGSNRISASRLYNLSQVLGVPVSYFFDDMPAPDQITAEAVEEGPGESDEFESMARRETLELVRAYYRIEDPGVRKRAFDLLKALGGDRIAQLDE
ncbi:helix-turn-helix domain-containing protein [Azospirillum picis]|uniref:Transcriptional regulator with XRE-family HTH domain n=1 Tax=Azospirillum picis TaxID=488438 RepID=A0ABU0MGQ4_9PROT|nr:helix-turn-helix transcriptional regulator [Azospirillum picis]MBP2298355.1 transcriptional regulator with XRE-family HTH domain [Azospirillum picis]MDQ0532596.1 transcriptional regulator with XRE-family HTH domain [Azospirillum picis]